MLVSKPSDLLILVVSKLLDLLILADYLLYVRIILSDLPKFFDLVGLSPVFIQRVHVADGDITFGFNEQFDSFDRQL